MSISQKKMITAIKKAIPQANPVPSEDFDGSNGGIWFKQEGELGPNGLPIYDYYQEFGVPQVNAELSELLELNGWYAENYDAGTLTAYPI